MRGAWLGGVAVLVVGAAVALAQPKDSSAEGKRAFEQANQELNLGHLEKALELLETSYRLTSKPELLYNLGYLNRQLFYRTRSLDNLNKAIDLYRSFLENAPGAAPDRRARAEQELKSSQDELVKEQAARARGEEALTLGEELVKNGRHDEAAAQLDKFVRLAGNERPGVVRALLLKAAIAAARGDGPLAADAFARALLLDRSVAPPPGKSDVQRRAFTQAQLRIGSTPALQVTHTPPASLRAGQLVDLVFASTPDPLGLVKSLQIYYRAGRGAFSPLAPQPVGHALLPRVFTQGLLPDTRVEYYAEVLDADGAILQHLGSPSLPFGVQTDKAPPKSVAKKWWFWTTMAGVAAAAAVGIGLGVHYSEPPRMQVPIFTGLTLR